MRHAAASGARGANAMSLTSLIVFDATRLIEHGRELRRRSTTLRAHAAEQRTKSNLLVRHVRHAIVTALESRVTPRVDLK